MQSLSLFIYQRRSTAGGVLRINHYAYDAGSVCWPTSRLFVCSRDDASVQSGAEAQTTGVQHG